ncbi:MAG: ribbon-helix-helix domain-containing protein [Hyphomicrobiales bacterium]
MEISTHIDVNLNSSLRVLQHKGQRFSVRLEDVFWEQLEDFSVKEKLSLSKFIHTITSSLNVNVNRTSFLRCYCLQRLQESAPLDASSSVAGIDLGSIITACPSPVFVLGNDRKIVAYNPAFKNEFLSLDAAGQPAGQRTPLRLTFSQPFNTIKSFLVDNPGRVVTAQVGFSQASNSRQYWVRFALADKSRGLDSLVVAFVGS